MPESGRFPSYVRDDAGREAAKTEKSGRVRSFILRAWGWHRWSPRWLPGPVAEWIRRQALRRCSRLVWCRLDTGRDFLGDIADDVHCTICVNGEWEGLIFESVLPLVPEGATTLDIGAHAGYGALRLADRVGPTGVVHAFEPLPHLEQLAVTNAEANALGDRIRVHRLAVAEQDGEAWLHYHLGRNAGLGSLRPIGRRARKTRVRTVALDAWLDAKDIDRVGFVKMDIEGGEALALRGMAHGLATGRYPRLLIELHPEFLRRRYLTSADRLVADLREHGYRILAWTQTGSFQVSPPAAIGHYILALGQDVDSGVDRLAPPPEETDG